MRDTVFILCRAKYRNNSSWLLLQQLKANGVRCCRVLATRYPNVEPARCRAIINYGVGRTPIWLHMIGTDVPWYNTIDTVQASANKARMTELLRSAGCNHLESTGVPSTAMQWLREGRTVVSRTILGGCKGKGIVLSPPDPMPNARLYTKLFSGPRVREYRVYIVAGQAIDFTEKRRWSVARTNAAGIDRNNPYTKLIRCNRNGWVFARNNLDATAEHRDIIERAAEEAARAFSMGVGAIDMIVSYTEDRELIEVAVVETNTSVGLNGAATTCASIGAALAREFM